MKRTFWALVILFVLSGPAWAESFRKVVLYQDMAYLTVEKNASNHKAVIDAPPEMVADSVSVTPSQGGVVKAVNIEPKRLMAGKAKQLKDQLDGKKAVLEGKKRQQKTVEREIELIFESAKGRDKDKEPAFSKVRMAEALSFIDERVNTLNQRSITLGKEIEDLSVEVKDLEDELGAVSRKQGFEITVELDSDKPVQVSYAVANGSWKPEYAFSASPAKKELKIETTAVMRQSTGTDWEIAELFVATGRPGFGIQAPQLSPWNIGLPRPYARAKSSLMMLERAAAAPSLGGAAEDEAVEPEVTVTATSYVIGAARSVVIPGDGKPKAVLLQKKTLETKMERLCAPKIDTAVYLRAAATWDGNAPILAGTYTAFVDGEFTGKGVIGQAQPGEKLNVDLGKDEAVKVERKDKVFHDTTLTGKERTTFSYTMTVKNLRTMPVQVTLKDQIPVSQDEAVKVDLIQTDPKTSPDKEGILTWELDVNPGATAKAAFSFSVTGMRLF